MRLKGVASINDPLLNVILNLCYTVQIYGLVSKLSVIPSTQVMARVDEKSASDFKLGFYVRNV
jgi:hypothetical protein